MAADAHYSISEVSWQYYGDGIFGFLQVDDLFNHDDLVYALGITFEPEEGYVFADDITVFYNGDPSIFDAAESYFIEDGAYMAFTIGFHVSDPLDVAEQSTESLSVWPNPTVNMLHLNVADGSTVSVFDMTGRLVMQQLYEGQLDVSRLAPGLYAIKTKGCLVKFVKE